MDVLIGLCENARMHILYCRLVNCIQLKWNRKLHRSNFKLITAVIKRTICIGGKAFRN